MQFLKTKDTSSRNSLRKLLRNKTFHRILICVLTIVFAFIIVGSGATPKKYKLNLGDKSEYDITAPREVINKLKTEQNDEAAEKAVKPVVKELNGVSIEVVNSRSNFISLVVNARNSIDKKLKEQGVSIKDKDYKRLLEIEQEAAANKLASEIKSISGLYLSNDQVRYLVSKASDNDISTLDNITDKMVSNAMKEEITEDNLVNVIARLQNDVQATDLNQELKNIGALLVKAVLKPNRTIDDEATELKKKEARSDPKNTVRILRDERIISYGETVTEDKLKILEDLNLLETKSKFDFAFAVGVLTIILALAFLLILYMNQYCKKIFNDRSDLILLCVITIITLLIARWISAFYTPIATPVFIAAMLISILLDVRLAVIVNIVLTILISLITRGSVEFVYMSAIGGTFSAFIVAKASQRSRLSMAGVIIGILNVLIIVSCGIINKSDPYSILKESAIVFVNGIVSMVLTLGILPFLETSFNIITPLKLLELANPNQPLVKRLLMEAPGTYHHSLMVGNLAEVATEAIGGNALLARVGAYFHDVGKLKRPNFFMENQMSDNPHDRMTANLSTLVITSHTQDGVELAQKYKIPLAIRDIIIQHHGTTLVAYFYHKAKKGEKCDTVKEENFRYPGPKPATKEAAVVMLADSVEAAVRSMVDKTEGKIEGLVRKIIKDKLDDGQLDQCSLTLKDLDNIAKGFMRVFSGFFHEREQYPEIKAKAQQNNTEAIAAQTADNNTLMPAQTALSEQTVEEGSAANDNLNRKSAG